MHSGGRSLNGSAAHLLHLSPHAGRGGTSGSYGASMAVGPSGTFSALERYSAQNDIQILSMTLSVFDRRCAARRAASILLALAAATCVASTAWAAESGQKGSEAILLTQILLLIFFGGLLGELMLRIGQPAVMGQLLAGLILGPSVLGALWPEAHHLIFPGTLAQRSMIEGVGQFGILMLLLLAGMETELALVRNVRHAAVSASLGGIAVPFACGFALGEFLPDALLPDPGQRLITSLFLGTALSISSVKIVATVVREMGFIRRNVGQVILASAIVDDTIGWIIIAITLSLATHGSLDWFSIAQGVLGTVLFLGLAF